MCEQGSFKRQEAWASLSRIEMLSQNPGLWFIVEPLRGDVKLLADRNESFQRPLEMELSH